MAHIYSRHWLGCIADATPVFGCLLHLFVAISPFVVLHHRWLKGEHTAALTMYENALRKSTAGGLSANVADGDDSNSFGEVDVEEHMRLAQVSRRRLPRLWAQPA